MSTESKPLPFYQLMDAFEAFSHGEPDVKPQHRSLYYFLMGYARKRGNVPRFPMPYEVGMHGSSIGSWTTYDTALRALAGWGFIVYTPGANRYKVPVVELTFRNPDGDELLEYWQSYCLAHPVVELQNQRPTPLVELQKCNPSPVVELQNQSPSPVVELQNCRPTANPSDNSTGDIKKRIRDREKESAASAAAPTSISEKKGAGKKTKKAGALPAEIAALPLPHLGAEFAELWRTFYTENTKQAGKPLTAFGLMLQKLAKYPEAFAVVMLEAAIQGNWSSVYNGGTAKAFDEWQAAQARQLTARPAAHLPPPLLGAPLVLEEPPNEEFEAQQRAREQAEAAERAARFRATYATRPA